MEASLPLTLPSLPERAPDSHKGDYGSVLIAAGSRRFPGAAALVALGAGRAGAGLVRLALPREIVPAVLPAAPFATVLPCEQTEAGGLSADAAEAILAEAEGCTSVVIGPGAGTEDSTGELLTTLLARLDLPVVLDADGLNLLAAGGVEALAGRSAPTVLTPHPGEFARLAGGERPAPEERVPAAVELARRTGAVVVLKGQGTVVTDGRRAYVEPAGNPGMATGGMGDVLAGVIGALLGVLPDPAEAAALGVHAHAVAGDLAAAEQGEEGLLPEDVAARIGLALAAHRADR
jgi:NAD(P)H-hydrate epimerase